MILGGFTGILFLFTVIPARFRRSRITPQNIPPPPLSRPFLPKRAPPHRKANRTRRRCAGRTGCWTSPAAGWKRSPSGTM
ncbi:MAG: hypothetical protein ACLUOF_08360 [Ruminococcus sp.]